MGGVSTSLAHGEATRSELAGTARRMLEIKIRKASQTPEAADELRQLILDGELRAGERFTQGRVAAQLGLPRTTVRMALEQLKHQRMLDSRPGGRYAVRSFSLREVADAIHLRGQLEGSAARLAAERKTGLGPLRDLNACLVHLDRVVEESTRELSDTLDRYVELNDAFHAGLFVLAGSDPLRDAYEALVVLPFAGPSAFIGYQSEQPTLSVPLGLAHAQHHKIANAIAAGDGEEAESLARNHADVARRELRAVISRGAAIETLSGSVLISSAGAKL
jgi:GntR family transcriptional regulator, vanillate catabolism transcriptional regulator